MIYSKTTAEEIIERFNLSPSVKHVWAHRGYIPDRYKKAWQPRLQLSKTDESLHDRILIFLLEGKINTRPLAEEAGVSYYTMLEFRKGTVKLSKQQLHLVADELKNIQQYLYNTISQLQSKKTFDKQDDAILYKLLINKMFFKKVVLYDFEWSNYKRVMNSINCNTRISDELKFEVITYYELLRLQIPL